MISINIWDDFYDDGHIPEGKIQETYMYVESDSTTDDKHKILSCVLHFIGFHGLLKSTSCELFFFDTRIQYPNLHADYEKLHFTRWELRMKNITHRQVESLVKELNSSKITYNLEEIEFYSES